VAAAHGMHTSVEAPTCTLPLPGGHRVHSEAPGAAEKEPDAQATQEEMEVAPGSGLERPAGQSVQSEEYASPVIAPYFPASQRKGRPPTQKAPVGHCWQEAAPKPE
jgi:hypothetical protein